MRLFEIILLMTCIILPFFISRKMYRMGKKVSLISVIAIAILHLIVEGYRWQMVPIYVISLIVLWTLYKELLFFRGSKLRKSMHAILIIVFSVLSALLSFIFPVFELPKPTGDYAVGSQYIHFITNQDEIITPETKDKRELMIKVWYPASINNEKKEPYLNEGDRVSFAIKYGLPPSIFHYLDYITTHTYTAPKVAKGKFPVLIFSHGHYSQASGYYSLIEEIVSHGYIVLNVNHTYESTGTLFPDGEIKLYDKAFDRKQNDQRMAEMIWNAEQEFWKANNWEEEHKAIKHALQSYVAADITYRWAKDISLVIDELSVWDSTTFLANHLDMNKIGVFGHSQGGAAAGESLLHDSRIKSGINIDGVHWGQMIDTTMSKPFALLSSDWPESHPDFNKHAYHKGGLSDFYNAKILGSGHSNFMDIPLLINLPLVNEAGTINYYKSNEITTKFVLNFFDIYLKNRSIDLLKLPKEYPEFKIEKHKKSNQSN